MTNSGNSTLFLVGGTGSLGQEVAKGLVTAEGYSCKKALVRDVTTDKAKTLSELGWELVEISDLLNDESALENALKGSKTIVSTLSGNDMAAIESAIIKAATKVGTSLFVPSQFGVDIPRWGTSFPVMAGKQAVVATAAAAGLPTLIVQTGFFSDVAFGFIMDLANGKATYVGDGNDKVSFTRRSDIGFVLAKALADPAFTKGGTLAMQGDLMSLNDATKLLGTMIGKEITITYLEPEEALKQEKVLLGKGLEGDIGAFFGAFALHLTGEPARGNKGCDLSGDAKTYDVKMETLEQTYASGVYGDVKI